MVFDAHSWVMRIREEDTSLSTIVELFEDAAALEAAQYIQEASRPRTEDPPEMLIDNAELEPWPFATQTRDSPEFVDDFEPDDFEPTKTGLNPFWYLELMRAHETYRRQILVLTVTYIELITEDFLKWAFAHRPDRMYNYLNQWADQKGKIDLREVLQADSRETLLMNLALRSAQIASRGKYGVVARNIQTMTRGKFREGLVTRIEAITEFRNRIVHEDNRDPVGSNEAHAALHIATELAIDLGRIAVECGMPVKPWPEDLEADG